MTDSVTEYANQVMTGAIPASIYTRLACERHLKDLSDSNSSFYFDATSANRIIQFASLLPTVKGKVEPINLQLWQKFILGSIFGWKRKSDHTRKYRTAYIQVARKNGKSTLASMIALYMLCVDKESGAEVYSVATTRDQAKIVYDTALSICKRCPDLVNTFHLDVGMRQIMHKPSLSKFCHLSSDSKSLEGLDTHCAIIDELHAHQTREVLDVMESSTGARKQSLIFIITTAGSDLHGIGHEMYQYAKDVLEDKHTNESFFTVIYQLDKDDDYADETTWIKANPNLGISLNPDDLRFKLQRAKAMSSAKANFLTKHMNIWIHSDSSWIDPKNWDSIVNPDLKLDSMTKYPCYIGLDLATRVDLASIAFLFQGEEKYYLITRHYVPESKLKDNPHYQLWHSLGHLTACSGSSISLDQIEQDIIAASEYLDIKGIAYDPYQSKMLSDHLEQRGIPMIEFRQTVLNMSPNMKIMESWIADKKLETDNNQVMRWCIQNTVCHTDAKDNIYPRKTRPENKIDGVVAAIMATGISQISVAKTLEEKENISPSVYFL